MRSEMRTDLILTRWGDIAVTQNEHAGQSIVFLHGNSMSSACFHKQFSELGTRYHVVAVDFPGHGRTGPSSDPAAYSFAGWESVLRDVHSQLELRDPVYVGQSLGGHVLLETLPDLAGVRGAALIGSAPFDELSSLRRIFLPDPSDGTLFASNLDATGARRLARSFLGDTMNSENEDLVTSSILGTDGEFRGQLAASLGLMPRRRELDVALKNPVPLAVFQGSGDRFINPSYFDEIGTSGFWGGKVHYIHDSGHLPHLENPAIFNPLLTQFVQSINA